MELPTTQSQRTQLLSESQSASQISSTCKLTHGRLAQILDKSSDVQESRTIPDGKPDPKAKPNAIKTTRFTKCNWLPLSLKAQFRRAANVYFLIVAILACTSIWEPPGTPKVIIVLTIFAVQALKDVFEDWKRGKDDKAENNRKCIVYDRESGKLQWSTWEKCSVGDIVRVDKDDTFPADMLLVATTDPSGECFVSTKSLDGETNLKAKKLPADLSSTEGEITTVLGENFDKFDVQLAPPTQSLFDMRGTLTKLTKQHSDGSGEIIVDRRFGVAQGSSDGGETKSSKLSIENFLLRGCVLENTAQVWGVVCFVNGDTRVRLNADKPPSKSSELGCFLNHFVKAILILICVLSVFFSFSLSHGFDVVIFAKYLIILYPVVPMTLYITFELLHVYMGNFIDKDIKMYDQNIGMAAQMRNTSILEELGQVDFMFSDKTGTLTANEMRFAACYVGTQYLGPFITDEGDEDKEAYSTLKDKLEKTQTEVNNNQTNTQEQPSSVPRTFTKSYEQASCMTSEHEFFRCLAICHEVSVGTDCDYQGASPDEVALVQAAKKIGYKFLKRAVLEKKIYIESPNSGQQIEYEILRVIPFSSDRKRMSVVCRERNTNSESNISKSKVLLITKGADSVMEKLLSDKLPKGAVDKLNEFALKGLRTLVIARRELRVDEWEKWDGDRQQIDLRDEQAELKLEKYELELEKELNFIGVTALEDRLQDKVPQTIAFLRSANIRVWVLTGDKIETAVEIAKMAQLFVPNMNIKYIVQGGRDIQTLLREAQGAEALVFDGASMEHIFKDPSKHMHKLLYALADKAKACIACRLSPMQKAQLVRLVREQNPKAITLSIGDGANDVPMIQAAHVGVGIMGKEGSASVQASDVAIGQFRFVSDLLFIHGRKAYRRLATFLNFFVYKGVVLGCCYVFYAIGNGASGQLTFANFLDDMYNAVTTVGISVLLILDTDIPNDKALNEMKDETALAYTHGPLRTHFNPKSCAIWATSATWHGFVAWSVPTLWYGLGFEGTHFEPNKEYWQTSFIAFTIVVIIVHYKVLVVEFDYLTKWGVLVIIVETLAYIPIVIFLSLVPKLSPNFYHVPFKAFLDIENEGAGLNWVLLAMVPVVALLPDIGYERWRGAMRLPWEARVASEEQQVQQV